MELTFTRQYVRVACDACKRDKRKCNGNESCAWCTSHALPCIYTANKRRGPQPLWRPASISWRDHAMFIDAIVPRVPLNRYSVSAGPDFVLSTATVRAVIEATGLANRMQKIVDRSHLLSSLGLIGHSEAVNSPSEFPACLRACTFMLLCVASIRAGDGAAADANYQMARECVDVAVGERPSQHLISALLLMALLSLPLGRSESEALENSAFAQRLSEFVPGLCPGILLTASTFWGAHSALRGDAIAWPASEPLIGQLPLDRAVALVSFAMVELRRDFVDVAPAHVPRFFALLDEAVELQATHGLFAVTLSIASTFPAIKALLSMRDGLMAAALEFATNAIDAYLSLPAQGCSLMCKYTIAKLLLSLPDLLSPGSCSVDLDVLTGALFASALRILSDPMSSFGVAPLAAHFIHIKAMLQGRSSRQQHGESKVSADSSHAQSWPRLLPTEFETVTSSSTQSCSSALASIPSRAPASTTSSFVSSLPMLTDTDRRVGAVFFALLALRSTEEADSDATVRKALDSSNDSFSVASACGVV